MKTYIVSDTVCTQAFVSRMMGKGVRYRRRIFCIHRDLVIDSQYSESGSESMVTPPPELNRNIPSCRTPVLIATLKQQDRSGAIAPIAPVHIPLGVDSSSAMVLMAAIFGAPVIDPQGKSASKMLGQLVVGENRALIVLSRW